ncbi:MAG: LPP20 family lipoprotein, partial [Spirochaetaceae bacterium]|nr:LPP20 family lipoprotein [Spirochaetaceae bacterium]
MKKRIALFFMMTMVFFHAHIQAQSKPPWVDKPSAVYPDLLYVSAVGSGQDRPRAEAGALGSLTAYFKQSVTSTINLIDTERQANGRSTSDSRMSQSIEAAAALDALIGAEIKNTWHDAQNRTWYAAAVMEKVRCRELYSGELDKTLDAINALIDISGGISFETIRNCQKAQGL